MDIRKDDIPYGLHTMVDIIGYDNFLEVCKMYGGANVYIPVYSRVVSRDRNRKIVREYNGKNIDSLRVKYGISNQHVKMLLKKEGLM